jgi:glycosyltransferase involved in cell wall biosynthesis
MRILVLNHEYPPIGGGGGRVSQDLNYGFSKHGHEVKLITPYLKGLPKNEIFSHYEVIRVPSLRKYAYRATLMDMGAFIISSYVAGSRLINTWCPDIIHGHFAVPAGSAARMLSKEFNIPYFLTAHLGDIPGGVPEKTERWFRFFYPFTKRIWHDSGSIITVSSYTRDLAKKSYPEIDPELIFNGVDTEEIKPTNLGVHSPVQIIFAGRFMEQKNPLLIIEVLNKLKDLPWHCVMMGDGPLKPAVEQKIKKFGLHDRFSLTGWINPEQVLSIYQGSDILFMPSRSEGLPVAGVQAIAMGLTPVLSDVGGCSDLLVQGESGYLLKSGDSEGFTEALQSLLNDREKLFRFKQKSREQAMNFDLNYIVGKYEKIMNSVIDSYSAK